MSKKQSSKDHKADADKIVRNIKRQARRKFNSEEKIRIVLAGVRRQSILDTVHKNIRCASGSLV